jgi:hypothetical protein
MYVFRLTAVLPVAGIAKQGILIAASWTVVAWSSRLRGIRLHISNRFRDIIHSFLALGKIESVYNNYPQSNINKSVSSRGIIILNIVASTPQFLSN